MTEWANIDQGLQVVILFGAVAGAVTAIFLFLKRIHRWMQIRYASLEWMFSEEHDHKQIKDSIDEVCAILKKNSDKQAFFGSFIRATLQANTTAFFETDATGAVIWVNKAYVRMMKISENEAKGMGFVNIIDPDHRAEVIDGWLRAVKSPRNYDEYIHIMAGDGERFRVHSMAYMINGENDKPLGYLGEIQRID